MKSLASDIWTAAKIVVPLSLLWALTTNLLFAQSPPQVVDAQNICQLLGPASVDDLVNEIVDVTSLPTDGTQLVYTVPLDKVFLMTGARISNPTSRDVTLIDGAASVEEEMAGTAWGSSSPFHNVTPIPFTESVVVRNNDVTDTFRVQVTGYLVDA